MNEFHFPNWINKFILLTLAGILVVGGYLATCLFAATHPTTVNIGHAPKQPVPYSHKLHVGKLKLDCRYCHNTVEHTASASIPPTATCGNCHGANRVKEGATLGVIYPENESLEPIRNSLETGEPVLWVKVHDVPDFVYFNHSAHVNRGVSCVSCHGRVDKMDVVTQVETLSMKWCLDCHRAPDEHVRPTEFVTALDWNPEPEELAELYKNELTDNFASLDLDHNGSLSWDEAGTFIEQPHKFDSGGGERDGQITQEELIAGVSEVSRKDLGRLLRTIHGIQPQTNCSTCHR